MVFSDLLFLFAFIPAFALLYLMGGLLDRKGGFTVRNWVLVFFSLLFYAWGEPVYVFLMLGCVLMNYIAGLAIARQQDSGKTGKTALVLGLIGNLTILCNFKYLGWMAQSLVDLGLPVPVPHIALPIGISFYTFQSISYLVDVYRKESPVQRQFKDLLLYISMFPQLIAGPIVRYDTVARELKNRSVAASDVAYGVQRFLIGLAKKVIFANQLGEVAGQLLHGNLDELSLTSAWVGLAAYMMQIYFDFSGYSDMAIGIGRCVGFHFKENFNHPYCCTSITDYWKRWHISLGSFFRDYVYIPLGGNRRHQILNIAVVWFLTGLWHGAAWNFVLWGLYFGVINIFEKYTIRKVDWIPLPLLHIYSLFLLIIGKGIFYFDDFGQMRHFFSIAFGGAQETFDYVAHTTLLNHFWLLVLGVLFCMPAREWGSRLVRRIVGHGGWGDLVVTSIRVVASVAILFVSVALLVGATNNAFLYTRF